MAEVLLSIIIPFQSFAEAICLSFCESCKELNVGQECLMFENYYALVLNVFPYLLRFLQCINKFYYSGKKIFLLNTIKHFVGIIYCFFVWLYFNGKYILICNTHIYFNPIFRIC